MRLALASQSARLAGQAGAAPGGSGDAAAATLVDSAAFAPQNGRHCRPMWDLVRIAPRRFANPALSADKQHEGKPAHWSYSGHADPAHWSELPPDFASCKLLQFHFNTPSEEKVDGKS